MNFRNRFVNVHKNRVAIQGSGVLKHIPVGKRRALQLQGEGVAKPIVINPMDPVQSIAKHVPSSVVMDKIKFGPKRKNIKLDF